MKCDKVRDLLPEEWAGSLDAAVKAQIEEHLAGCQACREERECMSQLWHGLESLPVEAAGPGVRHQFYAMLRGYHQGLNLTRPPRPWLEVIQGWMDVGLRRPALRLGFASLLLVAGFLGGYLIHSGKSGQEELATLRDEVHDMRQMVTISLLKQESASERLKGVSWSNQVSSPDPEFLSTLLHTLNYDPNVDVRLAAVDALSRFAGESSIREGLVKSLKRQSSPMVQISLIDLLVQLHERQSIEVFKQLTADPSQNQIVRQRALWGLQKLS